MRLTLDDVIRATGGRLEGGAPSQAVPITGISTDTRLLRPGDLFVALRGPQRDGHDFIADAFARGAAAALISRHTSPGPERRARAGPLIEVSETLPALGDLAAFYRRTLRVRVVGVTGSVGKTATAAMCAAVLEGTYRVARTRDDWNAEIGVPLTILGLDDRTGVAVLEMAMRGVGQIADLVRIARPEIGVVTNIGESHLELLGSIENVARAKGELIEGLPRRGTAVLNAEDDWVLRLRDRSPVPVLTFGLIASADVRADGVTFTDDGMRFRLVRGDGMGEVSLKSWGVHSVRNALAAAAVAQVMSVGVEEVAARLAGLTPPKMRLQPLRLRDILVINDAYNASPASMTAAFEVLRHVAGGRRRIVVLGEMKELGGQSAALHRAAGREAASVGAVLIIAGGADAAELAAGAREAATGAVVYLEPDAPEAAARLRRIIHPGDVVLIKGSRVVAMERVVDTLREDLQSPDQIRS
ncbi:MAG TPA: UDP-N-acetylmuramoyl-tripeptide--D-alanyl-D-alanine ligase [bacterium]